MLFIKREGRDDVMFQCHFRVVLCTEASSVVILALCSLWPHRHPMPPDLEREARGHEFSTDEGTEAQRRPSPFSIFYLPHLLSQHFLLFHLLSR